MRLAVLRLACLTSIVLLTAAGAAVAAVPREGRYRGPTTQEAEREKRLRVAFTVVRSGRAIRAIAFPSVARCGKRTRLRLVPFVRRPVRLVRGARIKLHGALRGDLRRGATYRAFFRMDGHFPTRSRARGTWGLRAVVRNRRGRVTARCETGTVRWRAARRVSSTPGA